jgi:hypothetical protein
LVGFRKTGKTAIKFGKSYDGRGTVSQRESLGRCLKLRARAKLACDATKVNDFNPYREGRNEPGPLWGLGLVGQCREAAVHAALPIAGPQSAHRHAGCWIVWQHIVHPVRPDEPAAANCTTDQTKTGLSLAAARKPDFCRPFQIGAIANQSQQHQYRGRVEAIHIRRNIRSLEKCANI